MRVVMLTLVMTASILGTAGLTQEPDQQTKFGNPVSRSDLIELPRRDTRPRIDLQRALKVAEAFIKKRKIDISSCYLFEAKLISHRRDEPSVWRFWWVRMHGPNSAAEDVKIGVTMQGVHKSLDE